ncbi:hypothetical protein vseg_002513 [Gypsophila vaccaria]
MISLIKHSKTLIRRPHSILRRFSAGISPEIISPANFRRYATVAKHRSPFDSNIIRILRAEIDCNCEYGLPEQPPPSFNHFSIDERPGEEYVRLTRKFGDEDIKIEATLFDGCISIPKHDDDDEDIRHHISVLVDIYKGEGSDGLGFACSAWQDGLEILKVYRLRRNGLPPNAHMGPHPGKLNYKLRKALHEYLEARGVNDDLSFFLHHLMVNKDRSEFLRWLGKLKTFVEL